MRISTTQIYQRALSNMLSQQEVASRLQQQLSSGLRVATASDDPIAAAQIELMNQRISSTELLQQNRQTSEAGINLEESVLTDTVSSLHRLREIQIQAGNSALSEDDRKSLGVEAKNLLNQLQDYANTKDSNGHFMFSGGQSKTQAISLDSSGQYIYNGDSTQRYQAVTGSLFLAVNDTGDNLFMRLPNGNGRFAISTTATPNLGTGSLSTGSVVDEATYVPDDYTMTFATNTQGQTVVMVAGTASGNVVPLTGLADDAPVYQEGLSVSFNGMDITVNGMPEAGDSFAISPAQNESIFSTVQRMIVNLNSPYTKATEKAGVQTENNQLLAQLDTALNTILTHLSDLGARLNQLESADKTNSQFIDNSKEVLKALKETDPIEVATQYNYQLVNLQAAQQSFVRIQGLSVFNYI